MAWLTESDGECCFLENVSIGIFSLNTCAVLVAEVTQPSLGVGYEIGRAVAMEKNTLCLYRPQPEKRKR